MEMQDDRRPDPGRIKFPLFFLFTGSIILFLALVDFLVSTEVGNHGEMPATTFDITCKGYLFVSPALGS